MKLLHGLTALLAAFLAVRAIAAAATPHRLVFDGVLSEHRLTLRDIDPAMPSDWTGYTHLVVELKTSSPQRFALWAYTADGPRRIELQPFGQNVWLRASIPLQYLVGRDQAGTDLASATNRRTNSFWMSLPYCLGTHWFTWRDQPVLGRFDGENYNIGFVDVTDRPYPELVEAAKTTHRRLPDVHAGKILPFAQKPRASAAGAPSSPWDL